MIKPMNKAFEKITEAALALPIDARALLADRLTESLDPLTDDQVRDLWKKEALRRLEEVQTSKVETISADAAMARIRSILTQ